MSYLSYVGKAGYAPPPSSDDPDLRSVDDKRSYILGSPEVIVLVTPIDLPFFLSSLPRITPFPLRLSYVTIPARGICSLSPS